MFVFFAVHKTPNRKYCWVKMKVVEQADGKTAVVGATVKVKVLRDNQIGYKKINRRFSLLSGADGYSAYPYLKSSRAVLGLPINWPLIFNASKGEFTSEDYVPRGHMIRIIEKNKDHLKDNLGPLEAPPIRMIRVSNANMKGKKVLLDPGHGVVYAND